MSEHSFRILHISDAHLHADRDARMRGVNTDASLQATLNHALADPRRPHLILATGDLVQDESREGYARFRELFGSLGLPVYCLPGNHDDPALMREILGEPPFQYCGTARHGNWLLVMLNSTVPGDDGGRLDLADLNTLEHALAMHREAHTLLALHHHPLPMNSRWLDSVALRDDQSFWTVCDRHPQVRAIVWGHVHQASDRQRNDVRLLSTPSTCAQFTPESDEFALDTRPPGYRWIDLRADGSMATSVVWLD